MAETAPNPTNPDFKAGENEYAKLTQEDEPKTRIEDEARAETMAYAAKPEKDAAAERREDAADKLDRADNPLRRAAMWKRDGSNVGMVGTEHPVQLRQEAKRDGQVADVLDGVGDRKADRAGELHKQLEDLTNPDRPIPELN